VWPRSSGDGDSWGPQGRTSAHRSFDFILEARSGRLPGQVIALTPLPAGQFDDRIAAEGVVIVTMFVAGRPAVETLTDHLAKAVFDELRVARVLDAADERVRQPFLANDAGTVL